MRKTSIAVCGLAAHRNLAVALCDEVRGQFASALNVELPSDGTVPEWIELIPAGPEIKGRDGRTFLNDRPDDVVARGMAHINSGADLVIDWEHSTERKAPNGERAPAAGWVKELANRDGAIWGRVEWTEAGADDIRTRAVRYLSPVFLYEKATGRIAFFKSAGLTNTPNLQLKSLNTERTQEDAVLPEEIRKALGLPEGATVEQAVNTIQTYSAGAQAVRQALGLGEDATFESATNTVKQLLTDKATAENQAKNPPLEQFVPRADYDTAVSRASEAERQLTERKNQEHEAEIDKAINTALQAGQITPATKEYYRAQCRQEGGLESFRQFLQTAPKIAEPTELDDTQAGGDRGSALNDQQQAIAGAFGNSAEDLKKYGDGAAA